jgi:hypothetical protein
VRAGIVGVHLGGMAADAAFWRKLGDLWFPNAVAMAGYGNSLVGMCPQLNHAGKGPPAYFPHGARAHFFLEGVADSGRGRVCFHRLDESCFLPNVMERDEAAAVEASPRAIGLGFHRAGLRDPHHAQTTASTAQEGLY